MSVKSDRLAQYKAVPQPRALKNVIDSMPAAALPEILVCVLNNCIRKKVYGVRPLAGIVHSLECRLRFGVSSAKIKKQT